MEFVVFECLTECFAEEVEHKYDHSNAFGPFNNFDEAIDHIIDRMDDVFTPSIGYRSIDDGPFEKEIYEPTVTEEEVRAILQEKQSYEIFGKKYEIRQLV